MIVKKIADHNIVNTTTCGEVREVLKNQDYSPLGIAICLNILPTDPHFHTTFDEIYFVLDGHLKLKLYDPTTKTLSTQELNSNELCVISKGIHHQVIEASQENRLCVISTPPFHSDDEHPSAILKKKSNF